MVVLSAVAEPGFEKEWEDYATGRNLSRRMPLFVKAATKINITGQFSHMRNHYEGTALDSTSDVGAGGYHSTFRPAPSVWESGGHEYVNERPVGVPYSATHFTVQLRGWLPPPIGGINWFSVDDASFSPHAPFHGCTTRVPWAYDNRNGGPTNFTFDAAFWVFNMVANFAYYRYDRFGPLVVARARSCEERFIREVAADEQHALALWSTDPDAAVEYLTAAAERRGNALVKEWLGFFQELFMGFRDGAVPRGTPRGYSTDWYDRIARETGGRYRVPDGMAREANLRKLRVIDRKMG